MKKKSTMIILIIIILLIVGYFAYRAFNFYTYYLSIQKDDNANSNFEITDTMIITNIVASDYITFDEVKMINDFKNFNRINTQGDFIVSYQQNNENGNNIFSYSKSEGKVFVLSNFSNSLDKKINSKEMFNKHGIKNDLDLIKFLSDWNSEKMNIFTNTSKLKENYFFNHIKNSEFPVLEKITLIEGKYQGYILYLDSLKEVSILKNNKNYTFLFSGEKFTDEYIKNFLGILVIE